MDNLNNSNNKINISSTLNTNNEIESTINAQENILSVEVRSPDKVLFKGNAQAVSSKNEVGPLDILPQHENFISILTGKIIIWLDKHQKQEIENQSAILKAKSNKVNIYLGVESLNQDENNINNSVNPSVNNNLQPTTKPATNMK